MLIGFSAGVTNKKIFIQKKCDGPEGFWDERALVSDFLEDLLAQRNGMTTWELDVAHANEDRAEISVTPAVGRGGEGEQMERGQTDTQHRRLFTMRATDVRFLEARLRLERLRRLLMSSRYRRQRPRARP